MQAHSTLHLPQGGVCQLCMHAMGCLFICLRSFVHAVYEDVEGLCAHAHWSKSMHGSTLLMVFNYSG